MPMFTPTLAMLALLGGAQAPRSDPAGCAAPGADEVRVAPTGSARARPLNEMPPARQVLTVDRRVDGCSVLLVKEGTRIVEEPVGRPDRRRVFRP